MFRNWCSIHQHWWFVATEPRPNQHSVQVNTAQRDVERENEKMKSDVEPTLKDLLKRDAGKAAGKAAVVLGEQVLYKSRFNMDFVWTQNYVTNARNVFFFFRNSHSH